MGHIGLENWVNFSHNSTARDETAARNRFDRTIMTINRLGAQNGDLFYHPIQADPAAPGRHRNRPCAGTDLHLRSGDTVGD